MSNLERSPPCKRILSPSPSCKRVRSPSVPRRRDRSPSLPRQRGWSPSLFCKRDRSPSLLRKRDWSPSLPRKRDRSPSFPRKRDRSPSLFHKRDRSPIIPRKRDRSPSLPRNRDRSPSFPRKRDGSPSFPRKRLRSPSPYHKRGRSPSPFRKRVWSPSPPRKRVWSPSPPPKRDRSPYGSEKKYEYSRRESCVEEKHVKYRSRAESPVRRRSSRHSPDKHFSREKKKKKKEPIRKRSPYYEDLKQKGDSVSNKKFEKFSSERYFGSKKTGNLGQSQDGDAPQHNCERKDKSITKDELKKNVVRSNLIDPSKSNNQDLSTMDVSKLNSCEDLKKSKCDGRSTKDHSEEVNRDMSQMVEHTCNKINGDNNKIGHAESSSKKQDEERHMHKTQEEHDFVPKNNESSPINNSEEGKFNVVCLEKDNLQKSSQIEEKSNNNSVTKLKNNFDLIETSSTIDVCKLSNREKTLERKSGDCTFEGTSTESKKVDDDYENDLIICKINISQKETELSSVSLEKNNHTKDNKEEEEALKNKNDLGKPASISDSTSLDDSSQCNYTNGIVEEEISEESRLIQMNPVLREFDILDDLEESEHEDGEHLSNSSEYESAGEEEVSIEDVDAMLDERLPDKFKDSGKNKEHTSKLKRKVVLIEMGHNHFDLLPEGWIQIMHSSGMPVYLHQKSRVCTMSRPYYLGPGSSRNHKIPLSSIPCLQYKRALEEERKNKEETENNVEKTENQMEIQLPAAKVETCEENEASQSLEALDLRDYCKKLFNFRTVALIPFKSWAERRKFARMTKDLKKRQRPSLPGGTKLLKFPIQNPDGTNSRSKGEWIINPNGKSYVCILHEYVQHALKKHPKYLFKELENPATPYSATVFIGDMEYSVGMGASKKQAKVEAAKAALEVLIPEMKEKIERDCQFGSRAGITKRSQNSDISIFDQIRVEDPRVAEFCAKTTEPPPYAILLTCLARNLGLGDVKVHYEMNSKKHKEDEYTMMVGEHKATVVCKNKRDGKQRAAQAILQKLHPNITHWGSLLRMYGNRSIKSVKEKKQEEQEITGLQSKASLNQPNYAILEKLRSEMLKLKEKRDAVQAKGKFTPPENIILPSLSSTDLNKVNLNSRINL